MRPKHTKGYNELSSLSTFEERYDYLRTNSKVGTDKFGFDRYLNQRFYQSAEWKKVRDEVIIRDNGCDMGLKDYPIRGKIYIHHIVPLTLDDVSNNSDSMLDPDNLVCVSMATHNAIHYGDSTIVKDKNLVERSANDTCPWRK